MICLRQISIATEAQKHRRNTNHVSVLLCFCGKSLSAAGGIIKQSVLIRGILGKPFCRRQNLIILAAQSLTCKFYNKFYSLPSPHLLYGSLPKISVSYAAIFFSVKPKTSAITPRCDGKIYSSSPSDKRKCSATRWWQLCILLFMQVSSSSILKCWKLF